MIKEGVKISDIDDFKKQLSFSLKEKEIIERLNIPYDIFLPIIFSIKFGGDWSLKTNSTKVMAVKEKITHFDEEKMLGYTLENMFLFYNPCIISQKGKVYRMEKCGNKKEREIVKRPYKVTINAEYAIKASMNPMNKKITLKKINGPFKFTGASAYGVSHEMEHLSNIESNRDSIFEFEYEIQE